MIEGGYNIELRENFAKHLANEPVFGFVVDGLFINGLDIENVNIDLVEPVIQATLVNIYLNVLY